MIKIPVKVVSKTENDLGLHVHKVNKKLYTLKEVTIAYSDRTKLTKITATPKSVSKVLDNTKLCFFYKKNA